MHFVYTVQNSKRKIRIAKVALFPEIYYKISIFGVDI